LPRRVRVHIVTVGASLLTNALRDDQNVKQLLPNASSVRDVENALRDGRPTRRELVEALLSYVSRKGNAACAELTSMSEHIDRRLVDLVYLLHTDTEVGEVCGTVLERHLNRSGIRAERRRIEGFRNEEEFRERGLQNLLLVTHELIKKHREDAVLVNATGGYKPEGTALSILAFVMGKPVYYRHEDFRTTVFIPPLPIDWREDVLDRVYRSALMDLSRGSMDASEFERRYGKEVAERMLEDLMLIRERDGKYEMTEFGRVIYWVAFSDP